MARQDILSTALHRVILVAGIVLIVLMIAATIAVLVVRQQDALDRMQWHLGNLSRTLAEQVSQSVHEVDLLGERTANELRDRFTGKQAFSDADLSGRLRERVRTLPAVRMVAYFDPAGDLVLHSLETTATALNFSDREHFQAHLKGRVEGLHIGVPVLSRMTPEWLNVFSRRVEDGQGGFRGVVSVSIARTHFERIFSPIELGKGGRVFLFRDDGVLLAKYPPDEQSHGRALEADPLFTGKPQAPQSGVGRRTGLVDDLARVVAYDRAGSYPLLVVVSATEDFALSPWRRAAWQIGGVAAMVIAFSAAALFLFMRLLRQSVFLRRDLDESARRLQGIIQSAMDAVITVDGNQNIVLFNAAAERVFRCPAAAAIGGPLGRFIPERFRATHREYVERFGSDGVTTRMMGARPRLFGLRADGEEFPIDASISHVVSDGQRWYTVILRDVTERMAAEEALRRSHDELRELSTAMNEVREAERLRVARELHDELAQWLTALKMDVSWMSSRLRQDQAPLVEKTEKMKGLVDATVAAVRRIASDLRPVILDDLGLVPAIESLLHDLSQRTSIVVSLDTGIEELDIQEPLATSLYRIAQEALTNVARHSGATEVQVTIREEEDDLVLRILDNGKGFDAEATTRRRSYGVLGIQERARTLGGWARILRGERGGTLVEIVIPIARYRKQRRPDDPRATR